MGESNRRVEQFRKTPKPCIYCGSPDGTTMDHIPPKSIFVKPRPRLITVPACKACNGGASPIDEKFKVFLSLTVGHQHEEGLKFWKEGGLQSIRRNHRLMRELLGGPRAIVNEGGTLKESLMFQWPYTCHSETIERLTRGLYYHHFNMPLGIEAKVDTYFFSTPDEEMIETVNILERRNIGSDEIFVYAFGRLPEHHDFSIWFYQFYKGHWAGAYTYPSGWENGDAALDAIVDCEDIT